MGGGTVDIAMQRSERESTSIAHRDDGVTVRIRGAGRMLPLPHDLAHFVVERELGLRQGFWGSVAAGALFESMAVVSGRQRPHAAERSRATLKANSPQTLRAEVLVGAVMQLIERGADENTGVALRSLAEAQSAVPLGPFPLDAPALQRVVAALREAAEAWQQVGPGGVLYLTWRLPAAARAPRRTKAVHPAERLRPYAGAG